MTRREWLEGAIQRELGFEEKPRAAGFYLALVDAYRGTPHRDAKRLLREWKALYENEKQGYFKPSLLHRLFFGARP